MQIEPSQMMVHVEPGSVDTIPFSRCITYPDYADGDSDCTDLWILKVDPSFQLAENLYYDLDASPIFAVTPQHRSMMFGFPAQLNVVDCDNNGAGTIHQEEIGLPAKLWRKDAAMSACFEFQILDNGDLKSFNGFSGAPLFVASLDPLHFGQEQLAGMVVRGSVESGIVRVVHHSVIRYVIKAFIAGEQAGIC